MTYTPKWAPGSTVGLLVAGGVAYGSSYLIYREGYDQIWVPEYGELYSPANRGTTHGISKHDFVKASPAGDLIAYKLTGSNSFGFWRTDTLGTLSFVGGSTSFNANNITENSARWSADGRYFGYTDGNNLRVFDCGAAEITELALPSLGTVRSFDINDNYLAVATATTPFLRVYSMADFSLLWSSTYIGSSVNACSLHPTLPIVAATSATTSVAGNRHVYDFVNMVSLFSGSYSSSEGAFKGVLFTPEGDGLLIFTANSGYGIRFYETATYTLVANPDWAPAIPQSNVATDFCFFGKYCAVNSGSASSHYCNMFDREANLKIRSNWFVGAANAGSVTIGPFLYRISNENTLPIRDSAGNPLEAVAVRAYRREGGAFLAGKTTDANGRFFLPIGGRAETTVLITSPNPTDGSVVIDRVVPE